MINKVEQTNIARAYSEVDAILEKMDKANVEKIPIKLRKMFKEEKDVEYQNKIDIYDKVQRKELEPKTLTLLAMLYLNYWCKDDEEKNNLIKQYAENDRKSEEETREKYNPDNLFKNKEKNKEQIANNSTETSLIIDKKKKWYKKIFNFIKNFIKK